MQFWFIIWFIIWFEFHCWNSGKWIKNKKIKGIIEFFINSAESSFFFLDRKLISIIANHVVFILFIVKVLEETVSWNEIKK